MDPHTLNSRMTAAIFTLASLGTAFVYKPEWITLYLRTTMKVIETVGRSDIPLGRSL
jgi:hypothetical protein